MADLKDSNFGALLAETESQLKTLNLEGIHNNVSVRKLPWQKKPDCPQAIVSPAAETILIREGKSGAYDVRYRILVSLLNPKNRDLCADLGDELLWRQRVRQHFHWKNARFAAASLTSACVVHVTVEPGEPLVPQQFRLMVDAQYCVLNIRTRENIPST